jgi:uncharacterized protein YgiM (DUF1202 family)
MNSKVGIVVALSLALAACSKSNTSSKAAASGGKFYTVKAESTSFFRYGPQQGSGPDQTLDKGTLMTLIRPSLGYCKVKLTTGQQGFVAGEDIGVAPAALAANAPASRGATRFRFDSPDPRLAMPPAPLPEFEPTPIPEPFPPRH